MEDFNYILEQDNANFWGQEGNDQQGITSLMIPPYENNAIQDGNGQLGITSLMMPPYETNAIQDANGQQGITSLMVPPYENNAIQEGITSLMVPAYENNAIQDGNGQQGITSLMVPSYENNAIQGGNGQQGITSLMVLPSETNPIQDCHGQQGTTGLVGPFHLLTKQHQLNQPNSPKQLIRGSGLKAKLTEDQKKENRRNSDKKYRLKLKEKLQEFEEWKRNSGELQTLTKRQAGEKLQSQQHESLNGQRDYIPQMLVGLPAATVPISSLGPPQLGSSSSTLTKFAPSTSIAPNLTTAFPGDGSNNRLIFFNSSTHLPLKLTPSNFWAWRQQLQALLIGYGLIGFVDGSIPSPPATPAVPADPSSSFNLWQRQDQLILYLILVSLTESMHPYLFSAQTSRDAWDTLHNLFVNGKLLAHEESLLKDNNVEPPVVVTANVTQRNTALQADSVARLGSGASNRKRPRQNPPHLGRQEMGYNTQQPMPNVIRRSCLNFEQFPVQVCQFCDSNGHVAKSCPKLATHPLVKRATSQRNDWLFDNGANNNATNDSQSSFSSSEYEVKGSMHRGVPTTRPE